MLNSHSRCRIYLSDRNYRQVKQRVSGGTKTSISSLVNTSLMRHATIMQEFRTSIYRKFDAREIHAFCVVFGKDDVSIDDRDPKGCVIEFAERFIRDIAYHPELKLSARDAFRTADVLTRHTSYAELMALVDIIEEGNGSLLCVD